MDEQYGEVTVNSSALRAVLIPSGARIVVSTVRISESLNPGIR